MSTNMLIIDSQIPLHNTQSKFATTLNNDLKVQ